MTIFWYAELCSLNLNLTTGCPDDGGSKRLSNVSSFLRDYTAQGALAMEAVSTSQISVDF